MHGLPKLDRIDINILSQLQKNGKLTNVTLADVVGLSPSPCLQRVKRLEKAGYIDRYAALINLKKLSDHVVVFTEVTLADHRHNDFVKFEADIRKHPHVMECHLVSGGYDYLLKFVARSVPQYQEIMETILQRNIGVDKYFSYVVIKSVVPFNVVPLDRILDHE
ncbi:Lrp/AsnC family transcriptional regulator [Roseovarius aestuarii]|uniref:Leucine-responsive regulatory protein n=1 Tax=Roseovarius aestuarii TaxID=475083 RepID=A0A1X7BWU5_9RHOB|nr:winged helix-turn-helix transcriptional regulator [Roseovarius aestuarii]SMC13960.1 Leucine-responsive regulatory protein [Roseovarius aestuarii]